MKRLVRPLLLVALFLQALMPLGWMPNPAGLGESAFVICAADGILHHGRTPSPDSAVHHDACIFAAHAAAPPQFAIFAAPTHHAVSFALTLPEFVTYASEHFQPQSPRGPPISV